MAWSTRAACLARAASRAASPCRADPAARVGQGLVEFLLHPGVGEVDGAAVRGDGAGQVLEHAPHLVVEPLVHRPAGRVARDGRAGCPGSAGGAAGGGGGGARGPAAAGGCSRRDRRTAGGAERVVAVRGTVGDGAGRRAGRARPACRRSRRPARPGPVRGWSAPGVGGGGLPGAVRVRRCAAAARPPSGPSPRATASLMPLREPAGLGQALVGEELGEAARVSLADRADLPGALPAVELHGDHGRLRVEAGEGVAGDLGAVETGDGDEGGGDGAEAGPGRRRPAGRASSTLTRCTASGRASRSTARRWSAAACRETSTRAAWGRPGGPPTRRRGPGPARRSRVAPATTGVPAETRISEPGLGERMVLPPDQLGRHRLRPPVSLCACRARPRSYRCGRIAGIRSWKVRPLAGVPRAVIVPAASPRGAPWP